jgi:hypothetical protein
MRGNYPCGGRPISRRRRATPIARRELANPRQFELASAMTAGSEPE